MAKFLAVYTMKPEDLAKFRAMPKSEQDRVDEVWLKQWSEWEERNAAFLPNLGGMVGKTKRTTREGIADATNPFCGYVIVETDTIEQAAELFRDHPHIGVFPGDGVDIMPFLTGPDSNFSRNRAD